jgi:hypothetical protein
MEPQAMMTILDRIADALADLMSTEQVARYAAIKDNITDLTAEVYDHTKKAANLVVAVFEDLLTQDDPHAAKTRSIRDLDPELFAKLQAAIKRR